MLVCGVAGGAGGDGAAADVTGDGDVIVAGSGGGDFDVSGPLLGMLEDRGDRNSIEVGGGDCEGAVGDVLGDGEADDVGGEGVVGDNAVFTLGDGAASVAVGEGGGVAGDALMVRVLQGMLRLTVPLVMTTVRVLQVMVLGVGPRMGGPLRFWAWARATPGGGLGWRWRSVGSLVLAVLLTSGVGVAPRQSWRRVLLMMLVVRLLQVMVVSMSVSWALQVWQRMMPRVRVL